MTRNSPSKYLIPAMILMMAAPSLAVAQSATSLSGLFSCEAISDKDDQLTCFRTETAKLRGPNLSAAPTMAAKESRAEIATPVQKDTSRPTKTTAETEKFIPITRDKTPKKRTLTIQSAASYGGNGFIRFTLANGEVWQQTEKGRLRLGRANPDKITIKKGALGSFRARVNDKAPSIRVKRVK